MAKANAKTLPQSQRVANVLARNTKKGITAERLASQANVTLDNVYRIVYDLKNDRGMNIDRNYVTKNGRRTVVYTVA